MSGMNISCNVTKNLVQRNNRSFSASFLADTIRSVHYTYSKTFINLIPITMEWILLPETWIALATLTALEIVLGIDNIIFLSIIEFRMESPSERRR